MLNWQEYVADTDPTNRDSILFITSLTNYGGGVRIDWRGGTMATQYVERCTNLILGTNGWTPLLTNPPPTPLITNFFDASATNSRMFYRLRVTR